MTTRVWDGMQQPGTNSSRFSQRVFETAGIGLVIAVFWLLDTLAKRSQRLITGVGLDDYRLIVEQVTSAVTVWMLVPAVAWWLTRFPLARRWPLTSVVAHVTGSIVFAAAHYFIMVGMRMVVYEIAGRDYIFSDLWAHNLVIEWQKDLKIYVAILAIVGIYRYIRQQRAAVPARVVVQSGTGECAIAVGDIEYLEACRNYMSVFTAKREYLLRRTMANIEESFRDFGFVRTHRSYVVNLARVTAAAPAASGAYELTLASGHKVPLSRSRRDEVLALLGLRDGPVAISDV